ncbi:right-handed parallel beta-helix repeat-containing protein [Azospirillum soli]|uniref:right-handed parallel beta-helix repeat-containing protein n=1 Tax=Azospirillum soli TaxID=1304799 RepID=UPI001AEAD63A|nr:right-handed parallel beta-helix repeat-containing protein [Azospirillum soli]MBP2313374.1 hypothetical protein [Azospirillum soli]
MSVLTTDSRVAHAADGVAKAFAYRFRVLEAGDLKVALRDAGTGAETPQTLNTHYTVTGVGAPMGGTVVFPAPPPMGKLVVVARAMPAGDHGYPDQPAEAAFDRLTLLAQQIQDQANRAVRFPEGDSPSLSAQLPASSARAGKALAFDGYGNVTLVSLASPTFDSGMVEWAEVHNTPTTLAGYGIADGAPLNHVGAGGGAHALASAKGAGFMAAADKAKLDGIPAGGGPHVSVKAFGAIGNGAANDFAAIQAALSSVAGGGTIFFPDGVYQIGAALSVPAGVTLLGAGGRAVIRPAAALESLLRVTGDGVRLIGLGFANVTGRAPRAVRLGDTGSPPGRPATARDVRIRDCRFQDFGQAIVVWDVEDVSVDGCFFTGCGTAFRALDNGSGTRFVGNLIRGGAPGIAFERSVDGGQAAEGVVIAHNRIEAGGGAGVLVKGGHGFVIAANAITEVGGWAVELDGSACAVASMRVADNWIVGGGAGGGSGGVLLRGDCRGARVTGNSVAGFAGHGLSAVGAGVVDARILHNVFDRIATADIDLDGALRTVVSGNECRANGGVAARPLVERGDATRSIVTHNSFGGAGPLRSAGSLYADNFGDDWGDGPVGGVGRVRGCRLSFGGNQPVEPGADVRLAWTAVEWDSDGGLDPTRPERIRVPAWARLARVTARLEFQGGGVVGGRILRCNAEGESPVGVTVSRAMPWIPVAPGDWFEIGVRNDGEVALELAGSGVGWVQVEFA